MALDLARQGRGRTSPNPMVGAVVVQRGEVVATASHQGAGAPHAEVIALNRAGERARGSTLYVNLEPCCHHGRTAPCTEVIIRAGVKKVVTAMQDPNPLVSGEGFRRLKEAGIKLATGVLEQKARHLNEAFITYITIGRPFVMIKTAMSFDGKIATVSGESRWITGEKARQFVHRLRHQSDALIVGIKTVLKDDPLLTTRLEGGGRDARRVVVDSRARLPLEARVINRRSKAPVILAVTEKAPADKCKALIERGVEILTLPEERGRVDLKKLMQELGKREMSQVLVEGGGTLNFSLLEQGLVDKLFIFLAPIICGGKEAPTAFSGEGVSRLEQAWRVERLEMKQFDDDLLLIGYPRSEGTESL